jgi:hypothetical protein
MRNLIVTAMICLTLVACSDDSLFEGFSEDTSYDSDTENASIALDDRDYEQVIFLLEDGYNAVSPDPARSRLLASAYMGLAQVDPVRFIVSPEGSKTTFDQVASLINTDLMDPEKVSTYDRPEDTTTPENYKGSLYIDGVELAPDTISDALKAKGYLEDLVETGKATSDDRIQLGFASAAHFVLYLGIKTADGMNRTLTDIYPGDPDPGMIPVPMNTAAYWLYRTTRKTEYSSFWYLVDPSDFIESDDEGSTPPSYQHDFIHIMNAVNALSSFDSEDPSTRDTLLAFLHEVLDVDPEEEITEELILENLTPERMYQYVSSF